MTPLIPGVNVCAYCKKSAHDLAKVNNKLLHLMRQHNPSYDRETQFCAGCKGRAEAKLARRERNEAAAAKLAKRSGTHTTSYSTTSGHVLSQSTSNESSKRSRDEAGPSRRVGKRTGGRPTQREGDNDDSDSSNNNRNSTRSQPAENQENVPLFQVPANSNSSSQRSNSQRNSSSTNRSGSQRTGNQENIPLFQVPVSANTSSSSGTQRSNRQRNQSDSRSVVVNIEYANDTDDEQNDNAAQSGDSFQSAPLRPNRSQRTETPRQLTPERMLNLTPQERSQSFQLFRRGGGG